MKKISLKLFPLLISLLFIFPILKENLSSFIVILICVNTIIYKIAAKDYNFIKPKTLLLTIPFWIILFRSFFSNDYSISVNHIQHALLFLIIPVFFTLIPVEFFNKKRIDSYLTILKLTCFLIAVTYVICFFRQYSLDNFFFVFQNVSTFRRFVYFDFTLFVIHPTYYTTILVFCSAHSLNLILNKKKYIELIFLISFLIISFLLLARLNIVLIVLTLMVMLFLKNRMNVRQKIVVSGITLISLALLAIFTPGVKNRFVEMLTSYNTKPENMAYDSTNVRMAIFDSSVAIAKENWVFGVGFENLQNKLNDTYKQNYDSSFYTNQSYLTHNYYFYIFLSAGILGLLAYLFYLINIIKICLRSNMFLFSVFLINVLIVCFIEDFFYRQYGILYFNLFLLCFIRYSESLSKEKQTEK